MMYVGAGILILVAYSGFVVVRTRDVTQQIIALGFYGLITALMFFFFQAPDVALSQITVGAVALPLMVMLAISRMKFRDAATKARKGGTEHD
jgi:energy-converting hydrogenase B subunit D